MDTAAFFVILGRLVLVLLSLSGLGIVLYKKTNLHGSCIPVLELSLIVLILYGFGLCNMLEPAVYGIWILGVLCLIYALIRRWITMTMLRKQPIWLIFFVLLIFYTAYYLKDNELYHYDNFTHWGLIVKTMLLHNVFPDAATDYFTHLSYPPASALNAYFFCRLIGTKEAVMVLGQNIYILSAVLPVFALFQKQKNLFLHAVLILVILFLLPLSVPYTDLLVDTLLPMLALALTCIILYTRKNGAQMYIAFAILSSCILLVKNSGIFYILVNGGLMIWVILHERNANWKKEGGYLLGSLFLTVFVYFLWKAHLSVAFTEEMLAAGRHSMSMNGFSSMLEEKTIGDIAYIFLNFWGEFFNLQNLEPQLYFSMNLVFLFLYYYMKKAKNIELRVLKKTLLIGNGIYLVYQFSLIAMYIFSMPMEESLTFAGYGRYSASCLVLLFALLWLALLYEFDRDVLQLPTFTKGVLLCIVIIFGYASGSYQLMFSHSEASPVKLTYDHLANDYAYDPAGSFLIYAPASANDSYYSYNLSVYSFLSKNITMVSSCTQEAMNELASYDYLVVVEDTPEIEEFLIHQDLQDSQVIGVYELDQD